MPRQAHAPAPDADAGLQCLLGQWQLQVETPIGTKPTQLFLAWSGQRLVGWMLDLFGRRLAVADVRREDGRCAWRLEVSVPVPLTLHFSAEVDDAQMTGYVRWQFPDMSFVGTRLPLVDAAGADGPGPGRQ